MVENKANYNYDIYYRFDHCHRILYYLGNDTNRNSTFRAEALGSLEDSSSYNPSRIPTKAKLTSNHGCLYCSVGSERSYVYGTVRVLFTTLPTLKYLLLFYHLLNTDILDLTGDGNKLYIQT